jgi:hypothetical protein
MQCHHTSSSAALPSVAQWKKKKNESNARISNSSVKYQQHRVKWASEENRQRRGDNGVAAHEIIGGNLSVAAAGNNVVQSCAAMKISKYYQPKAWLWRPARISINNGAIFSGSWQSAWR